jgi:toxin HigB-1
VAIEHIAHKGVREFFFDDRPGKIGAEYRKKMHVVLSAMDAATCVMDLENAFGFHALKGDRAGTFAMTISANWRVTFRFELGDRGDILDVDFEDYH